MGQAAIREKTAADRVWWRRQKQPNGGTRRPLLANTAGLAESIDGRRYQLRGGGLRRVTAKPYRNNAERRRQKRERRALRSGVIANGPATSNGLS